MVENVSFSSYSVLVWSLCYIYINNFFHFAKCLVEFKNTGSVVKLAIKVRFVFFYRLIWSSDIWPLVLLQNLLLHFVFSAIKLYYFNLYSTDNIVIFSWLQILINPLYLSHKTEVEVFQRFISLKDVFCGCPWYFFFFFSVSTF